MHTHNINKKYLSSALFLIATIVLSLIFGLAFSQHADAKPNKKEIREARKVVRNAKKGRIAFMAIHPNDRKERTTAKNNIVSIARGKEARTTRDCTNRNGTPGPYKDVRIKLNVLKFMNALAKQTKYSVTSITGQCHSANSAHYYGEAIDIGCNINKLSRSDIIKSKRIARKFGMAKNSENCTAAGGYHHHFSVGGR